MKPESITIDMTGDLFRPIKKNGKVFYPISFVIETIRKDGQFKVATGKSWWRNYAEEDDLVLPAEIRFDEKGEVVDYYIPEESQDDKECYFNDDDKRYSQNFWSCATFEGKLSKGLTPVGFYGLRIQRLTKTLFAVFGKIICWNPETDEYSICDGKLTLKVFLEPFKFTALGVWLNHWERISLEVL